ncbi:putative signal transducing protein [Xanthobacter sp. TB0136]|uniref:putative signal transducing protein n=1 Tax=Xanthobacter sp. TB0136 TaxID=3459177 RepID=UPI004039EF93
MRELLRTNDVVLLGAIEAFLNAAGIDHLVVDVHISAVEGSIGILPRRILVLDEDMVEARRLLIGAGFGEALPPADAAGGFWAGRP